MYQKKSKLRDQGDDFKIKNSMLAWLFGRLIYRMTYDVRGVIMFTMNLTANVTSCKNVFV